MNSIKLLCHCTVIFLVIVQLGCSSDGDNGRPETLLFDEAEILDEIEESVTRTLDHLRKDYGVEVVLATVKSTLSVNPVEFLP